MTTPPKRELRTIHSTTHVARSGVLTIIHVVDLEALMKAARDGIELPDELPGSAEVMIEIGGEARVARRSSLAEAEAFVAGFAACADSRSRRAKTAKTATPSAKKRAKKRANDVSESRGFVLDGLDAAGIVPKGMQ